MKTEFFKRVGKVFIGTLGSQLITMGVMLILVRLYSPEDLGLFNVWLSFATILAVLATGRYELALFSGDGSGNPKAIVKLIFLATVLISLITSVSVLLISYFWGGIPEVVTYFIVALFFAILSVALNKSLLSVLVLQQKFSQLSFARFSQAFSIAVAQVIAGSLDYGLSGLIYGQLFGLLGSTVLVCLWCGKNWLVSCLEVSWVEVKYVAKTYIDFPKLSLPADFINTLASQLPIVLLAHFFGPSIAGWYALTVKMLGAPVTLLASSVLDVFKEQAARDFRENGNCVDIFIKTFRVLALLAIVPFVLLWFFAEWGFGMLFGEEWIESGKYAAILVPLFYMRFIVSPLSYTIYIAQRQKLDLYWQILLLLVTIGSFVFTQDVTVALWSYSILYSLMYVIYFVLSYRCAKG